MRKGGESIFFKKKELKILSPFKCELISIKDVPDPTFNEEILGKGIAAIPMEDRVYSPVSGRITTVFHTLHAIGITTKEGIELLVHIGIDTVNLRGEWFKAAVQEGDFVKEGDLLLEVNFDELTRAGYRSESPIVICSSDKIRGIIISEPGIAQRGDVIMKVKL